jgi:anti-sigma factor RsiW
MYRLSVVLETRMTPESLAAMLRNGTVNDHGRGPACPDEHAIAAYVDGAVGPASREALEAHMADCDHCLALVGLLSRERAVEAAEPAAESAIAGAQAPIRPVSGRQMRPAPRWAAAAAVVVALGSLVLLTQPQTPPEFAVDGSTAPTTRAAAEVSQGLTVLSPRPGATVSASELAVRWTPVAGSRYYDVRIVTDAGDVVTEEHVSGTAWRPQDPASLRPGVEYFVHVDAFVSDDKSVSSDHVPFRVED